MEREREIICLTTTIQNNYLIKGGFIEGGQRPGTAAPCFDSLRSGIQLASTGGCT